MRKAAALLPALALAAPAAAAPLPARAVEGAEVWYLYPVDLGRDCWGVLWRAPGRDFCEYTRIEPGSPLRLNGRPCGGGQLWAALSGKPYRARARVALRGGMVCGLDVRDDGTCEGGP